MNDTHEHVSPAGVSVGLGFDIFKRLDDGTPLWIMEVATLDDARKNLEALVSAMPGEYFLRDASTGEVIGSPDPLPPD